MYFVEDIQTLIKENNVEAIKELIASEKLEIKDGKLVAKVKEKTKELASYWDDIQLIRKIQLNSVYGALSNQGSNYYDLRLGQSCTLTGRCITRHMAHQINFELGGTYELGSIVVTGDTDSVYFTVPDKNISKDDFIKICDDTARTVNGTFGGFLNQTYNLPKDAAAALKCGREICAESALIVRKKRYAAFVYDEKGFRYDKDGNLGKLKIVGIDIKRSDTPKWVQEQLEKTMYKLLAEHENEDNILQFIREWRNEYFQKEPWKLGRPMRANNLTKYTAFYESKKRGVTIPGHVRASINWNKLLQLHDDKNSMKITDGQKVIVCKLRNNRFGIEAIAYPIDQQFLPDWFKNMNFNKENMVIDTIDQKIELIFGKLNWDLNMTKYSNEAAAHIVWE